MDRKNEPVNFRSADDEMFAFLSSLGDRWRVSEGGVKFIEENFALIGSKPVLRDLKDYATADCLSFAGARSFIDANPAVKARILGGEICYLGDSLTSAEVKFAPEYFYDFLKFIMEQIPEHHYFFSPTARWLLLVAMEKCVEFAKFSRLCRASFGLAAACYGTAKRSVEIYRLQRSCRSDAKFKRAPRSRTSPCLA